MASYTSTAGNWDGSSQFTPTDGSTPAASVSVNDWVGIYVTAPATYFAQVMHVASGVNGLITTSQTSAVGTPPVSGSGTVSLFDAGPLYLPYEFTSVPITAGNTNPFDIDPEQTTLITASNTNPFDIDPEQTTLITIGLTAAD